MEPLHCVYYTRGVGQTVLVPPTPWQLISCAAGMGNRHEVAQWLLERDDLSSYRQRCLQAPSPEKSHPWPRSDLPA